VIDDGLKVLHASLVQRLDRKERFKGVVLGARSDHVERRLAKLAVEFGGLRNRLSGEVQADGFGSGNACGLGDRGRVQLLAEGLHLFRVVPLQDLAAQVAATLPGDAATALVAAEGSLAAGFPDREAALRPQMLAIFTAAIASDGVAALPALDMVALVEDNADLLPDG
jgi:hypothetical protein